MFLATEKGSVEVWNIEKSIRVRTFELQNNRKSNPKCIRAMMLAPDESFLAVANKDSIAYYSTSKLKSNPSSSVFSGLETDNPKNRGICAKVNPLNAFECSNFDVMEVGVNPANLIMMITRNQN